MILRTSNTPIGPGRGIAASGAAVFTPDSLARKARFWLNPSKAVLSGSNVTSLPDAMRGGTLSLTGSGTLPTIDTSAALPAITIAATDSQLVTFDASLADLASPAAHTMFTLVKLPAGLSDGKYDILGIGSGGNVGNLGLHYGADTWRWTDTGHYTASSLPFASEPTNGVGHWILVAREYDGTNLVARVMGQQGGSGTAFSLTWGTGWGIMSRNNVNGMVTGAKVGHTLLYSGTFTPGRSGDRWKIEQWYGAQMRLLGEPVRDPYIVFAGDSLTQNPANTSPNGYPYQCVALLSRTLQAGSLTGGYVIGTIGGWCNEAIGGTKIADMAARAIVPGYGIDNMFTPLRPLNILCIWDGTNDIGLTGVIADPTAFANSMIAAMRQYILDRRAAGADKVLLLSTIARFEDTTGGHLTTRNLYNAGLAALAAEGIADLYIDLIAADSRFGDYNSAVFDPDRVHLQLGAAGYGVVSAIVAPYLNAWVNSV